MGGTSAGEPAFLATCHVHHVCQLKIYPALSVTMAHTCKMEYVFQSVSL